MRIHTINQHKLVATILALIVTFVVYSLVLQHFALKSFNVLEIEGFFPDKTQIQFENSTPLHGFSELTRTSVMAQDSPETAASNEPSLQRQTLRLYLSNRIVDRFKLTIFADSAHEQVGQHMPEIKRLRLFSHFSKQTITWQQGDIKQAFISAQVFDPTMNRQLSTLELKQPLTANNFFIAWLLPLFMAMGTTILLLTAKWPVLPVLDDVLSNQQGRNQHNFAALDGLRGLAALLVLMEHTMSFFAGIGHLGVWLFFVLSGFLLMKPFVVQPEKMLQGMQLARFMQRRIKRIIPMYFFMITCVFLFNQRIEGAIRHYLLVQADGHYWSIVQEMYFYILLPIIASLAYLVGRGRPIMSCLLLFAGAAAWSFYNTQTVLTVYSMSLPIPLFFEVFTIGMIGTYLFHGIFVKYNKLQDFFERHCVLLSLATGLLFLLLLQLFMLNNTTGFILVAFAHPLLSAALCLVLILMAVMLPAHSWYNRILASYFLRYIGIIGFSFYLIHPYMITLVNYSIEHLFQVPLYFFGDLARFIISLIITVIFASLTYSYIERPFLINKPAEK